MWHYKQLQGDLWHSVERAQFNLHHAQWRWLQLVHSGYHHSLMSCSILEHISSYLAWMIPKCVSCQITLYGLFELCQWGWGYVAVYLEWKITFKGDFYYIIFRNLTSIGKCKYLLPAQNASSAVIYTTFVYPHNFT